MQTQQVVLFICNIVIGGERESCRFLFSRALVQAVWPTEESRFVSGRIAQIGTVGVKTEWLVESLE